MTDWETEPLRPQAPDQEHLDDLGRRLNADLVTLTPDDPANILGCELVARFVTGPRSIVYLALSGDTPSSWVVVKTLPVRHEQVEAERFRRECEIARSVETPAFARVLGFQAVPTPALVQEFVSGEGLNRLIRSQGEGRVVSVRDAVLISLCVLDGIAALHERRIVHRDVKPANIILSPDRGPVLIDFGIARRPGDPDLTARGYVVGTARYMAPEALRDEPPGPSADVFSWAVIAAQLLCRGRHPFDPDGVCQDPEVMGRRIVSTAPDLRGAPWYLQDFLRGLLSEKPSERAEAARVRDRFEEIVWGKAWHRPIGADVRNRWRERGRQTRSDEALDRLGGDRLKFTSVLLTRAESGAESTQDDRRTLLARADGLVATVATRLYYRGVPPELSGTLRAATVLVALLVGLLASTAVSVALMVLFS